MPSTWFRVATYATWHYVRKGDPATRLHIFGETDAEGNAPTANIDLKRCPCESETLNIYVGDQENPTTIDMEMPLSRLSEWIDTLRNEEPLWFYAVDHGAASPYPPFAALFTGDEPVGENEPQP